MGRRKKGLAAIFSPKPKLADSSPSPPWPWPSCAHTPDTASFHHHNDDEDYPCSTAGRSLAPSAAAFAGGRLVPRSTKKTSAAGDDNMYKTVNSVYFDSSSCRFSFIDDGDEEEEEDEAVEVDECLSYSTATASEEWSEAVIRSLGRRTSTDRFFFDYGPPEATNSILAASRSPSPSPSSVRRTVASSSAQCLEPSQTPAAAPVMPDDHLRERDEEDPSSPGSVSPLSEASVAVSPATEDPSFSPSSASVSPLVEESVAVVLDSSDPYADFRSSMEEMVAAHGLRTWPDLEALLSWYLRINAKHNHRLIVGAFVDLLVALASSRSGESCTATTTTTTVTMTTTTTATATASSGSSSSTSSSVAGDGGATTCTCSASAAEEEEEQCDGGGYSGTDEASCFSPGALSSDQEEDEDAPPVPPVGKEAIRQAAAMMRMKLCTLDSSSL